MTPDLWSHGTDTTTLEASDEEEPRDERYDDPGYDDEPSCPQPPRLELRRLATVVAARIADFAPGSAAIFIASVIPSPTFRCPLALLASVWMVAAAARSLGLSSEPVWRASLRRGPSHLLTIGTVALFASMATWPSVAFTTELYRDFPQTPELIVALTLLASAGLFVIPIFIRLWPAATVTFTGSGRETAVGRHTLWLGPGLRTAWRLTGQRGAFLNYTVPVLKYSLALFGGFAVVQLLLVSHPVLEIVARLAFCLFFIPIWSLALVRFGHLLHATWLERRDEREDDVRIEGPTPPREARTLVRCDGSAKGDEGTPHHAPCAAPVAQPVGAAAEVVELKEVERPGRGAPPETGETP